jgi:hypothetical protein
MERATLTLETERAKWPTPDVYDDEEQITVAANQQDN